MFQLLGSRAFALLGAVALFNLVSDLIVLHQKIQLWVDAWQAMTRPIWDFVFGWVFDYFSWPFPDWLRDYFTAGVIFGGSVARGSMHGIKSSHEWYDPLLYSIISLVIGLFFWPIQSLWYLISNTYEVVYSTLHIWGLEDADQTEYTNVNINILKANREYSSQLIVGYFEAIVYFVILLGVSYAFLYAAPPSP